MSPRKVLLAYFKKLQLDSALVVELLVLLVAAPLLYFPNRFHVWAPAVGFLILLAGLLYRRYRLGIWYRSTPADLPLLILFVVLLPIAVWAAPPPLRVKYSIPRTYILLWNLYLFTVVVLHSSRNRSSIEWLLGGFTLGTLGIAVVAPLGISWLHKLPGIATVVTTIPSPLMGVFTGAESGFHPNQVAGTLLYALPLMAAVTTSDLLSRRRTIDLPIVTWLIWIATPFVFAVLLLTQSRTALLAMALACAVMILINFRLGRWLLLLGAVVLLISLPFIPVNLVDTVVGTEQLEALGGTSTLGFRQDVWSQAYTALHDFPITGMGLGTFREILFLLYPTSIPPDYNVGHAHNFFLQVGVDFGLGGLIAVIAIHILALVIIARMLKLSIHARSGTWRGLRVIAVGLLGGMIAHLIYSQLDAVAMGAKTNFMFWYLLALIFGLGNYALLQDNRSSVDGQETKQSKTLLESSL